MQVIMSKVSSHFNQRGDMGFQPSAEACSDHTNIDCFGIKFK